MPNISFLSHYSSYRPLPGLDEATGASGTSLSYSISLVSFTRALNNISVLPTNLGLEECATVGQMRDCNLPGCTRRWVSTFTKPGSLFVAYHQGQECIRCSASASCQQDGSSDWGWVLQKGALGARGAIRCCGGREF